MAFSMRYGFAFAEQDAAPDDWHQNLFTRPIVGKGICVFTHRPFYPEECIGMFEGVQVPYDTMHSVTIGNKKIEGTGILRNLAHSCSPNAYFKGTTGWLYSKDYILSGTEITIDYEQTEPNICQPFVCKCGSPNCRHLIGKRSSPNV